ncbi:MAG TPA: hypothetical protein VLI40_00005, partial [Gemmatimonadaceae bacterium]|nr:hypothetical protein [Gemmatimonadaceae bacterium]
MSTFLRCPALAGLAGVAGLLLAGSNLQAQSRLSATAAGSAPPRPVPAYAMPGPATVTVGASTPDSLAQLVLDRFATGTPAAFDSIYPDPFGRMVVASASGGKTTREAGLHRVLYADGNRAVLLLTGTVQSGTGTGLGAGSDETNRVRRFSGLYEAVQSNGVWMLTHQIPLDTANYIHTQTLHVALTPGKESRIVDTLSLTVGSPYGFAARINNATQIQELRLDGRPVKYALGGGVLWIKAPARPRSQLVMKYTIAEDRDTASAKAKPAARDTTPAYAAMNNTDAWHPFFNYDSGHDFGQLTVTATVPAEYRLSTTIPQTETVANGVRTVHGTSMHPQFLLALVYDRDWKPVTSKIGNLTFETFLSPDYHFQHDTLASVVGRVYRVLVPRFGEPQLPSHYLAVVEERALGHGGFAVRMNNAVISGDRATLMDESVIGPSYPFA